MEKKYIRITKGLADKGELILAEEFDENFSSSKDHYASHYYYNETHYNHFKAVGSVKGITDVKTDKLIWDFDSKRDVEQARQDTLEAIKRLKEHGIPPENVEITFSGNKGFCLGVKIDKMITPKELAQIGTNIGDGLESFDASVYNPSRVIRLVRTKHDKTDFYKTALTLQQLKSLSIQSIQAHASQVRDVVPVKPVALPATLIQAPKKEEPQLPAPMITVDLKDRPRHWKEYKWALMNAVGLKEGERNNAMMVIASTCRAFGYPREIAEGFLNTFDQRYAAVTKGDLNPGMVADKLNSVYAEGWNGGQYSIKNNAWLQQYCKRIGVREESDESFVTITDIADVFNNYANEFEKNIVRTGIEELDENALFMASTHNGVLGQPGSGKTSFSLQWLRNASKEDSCAIFYSLDMAKPIVYGKLVQQEWGCGFREGMSRFKNDRIAAEVVKNSIRERYKNVSFNFNSGTSVEKMEDDVKRFEDQTGKKCRLVITDYLECLQGPYSDQTANTGYISNQMKDFANKLDVCSVMLLQTQKHSTSDISDALLSMKQIKGSSVIEQASSIVLTLWREGYNPKTTDYDKFLSFAVVKNRFGSLWTSDFAWNGRNGVIDSLTDEQREGLKELRELKKRMKLEQDAKDPWK